MWHIVLGAGGVWLMIDRSAMKDALRSYSNGLAGLLAKKPGLEVIPSKINADMAMEQVRAIRVVISEDRSALKSATTDRNALEAFNKDVLSKLRAESAVLPSAIEWVDRLQAMIDSRGSDYLLHKPRPAVKSHQAVQQANARARCFQKESSALKNLLTLYEKQAPWLPEVSELSLQDVLDGLRIQQKLAQVNDDPVTGYLSATEFASLSVSERNQRALDRYFEYRQRNAALAGRLYERYIGYMCEQGGWDVKYQGATEGVADGGLDLICTKNGKHMLVQCKRLSKAKGSLVRENTVAQIFGAARYFALKSGIRPQSVLAKIVTTSELSDEAKLFAAHLKVAYQENIELGRYPAIKCNVSADGELIYHLPMDQQYDKVVITPGRGECYKMTVAEAEAIGFRRAYKWMGGSEG